MFLLCYRILRLIDGKELENNHKNMFQRVPINTLNKLEVKKLKPWQYDQ